MTPPTISVTPKHTVKDVVRFFWQHCKRHWALGIAVLFFGALGEVLQNVIAPLWYKRFVDAVTHASTQAESGKVLFIILIIAVGIRFFGAGMGNIKHRLSIRFQLHVMHALHHDVLQRALAHSYRFFTDQFTGSLTRKLGRITELFGKLADIFMTSIWGIVFSLGGILIVLSLRYPLIAAIVFIWICILVATKTLFIRSRMKYFAEFSRLDAAAMGIMSDVFGNAVTVKAFANAGAEVKRFLDVDEKALAQNRQNWDAAANLGISAAFLNTLLEVGVLGTMILLFVNGSATVGDVVLVQSYLLVVFGKLDLIHRLIRQTLESSTQVKEVLDIIWSSVEVENVRRAKSLQVSRGKIEFRNVHFAYQGNIIFDDLNLIVSSREKTAFVGSSGAGKSTLTKLLLRFYDLDRGSILVDGQDISKVTQDSLRSQIALVPQDPALFHRSLKENIQYGKADATEREIIEAAKKAHCHEFITKLPQGYDTPVGERGVKLSGGERQRVAIARAILKNAPILVLDEATSSLDSESESLIQDALHTLMKNKTVIVIAHRLSTIMEMDRIIVMEQGRVVDEGTHDELLQKVGIYQKLWNIQAGGFASE